MIKISNLNKKIKKIKASKSIKVNICVNSKKAKRLLSWYPKIHLDKGLKKRLTGIKKMKSFYKNKNILVTGGSGMIGFALVNKLYDLGANLSVASLERNKSLPKKVKFLKLT